MLGRAKRKSTKGKTPVWMLASAENLPLADDSFDRVLCSLLLHHLDDAAKTRAIGEMHRLLKPGGRLVLADYFQPASQWARLRFLLVRWIDGWRRTRFHVQGSIESSLCDGNFVDVRHAARIDTLLGTLRIYVALAGSATACQPIRA